MNTQDKDKRIVVYRVTTLALLLAWIFFIFHNSMENADLSSSKSGALLAFIKQFLGSGSLLTEYILRKMAHFTEFAIEGVLLLLVLLGYTERIFPFLGWPLLGGLLTALTDETIQLFSDGRASQVTDVWIDFAGVVTGILLMSVLFVIIKRKKRMPDS